MNYVARTLQVLAVAGSLAIAGSVGALAGSTAADSQAFLEEFIDTSIEVMTVDGLSDDVLASRFRVQFRKGFDVAAIGRFVLGRYWRKASDAQRAEYLTLFEDLMVETYAPRFRSYNGEQIEYTNSVEDGENGALVKVLLRPKDGAPIRVDWRIRRNASGEHKVVDIVVEGISMAIAQRSDFASVIQSRGGNIEGLMVALRDKTEQMRLSLPSGDDGQTN